MTDRNPSPLAGRRLLIVEDEYMLAADLETMLENQGATVVGMAGTVALALKLLKDTDAEAAVLDLNLDGEVSIPVAAAFAERAMPFVIVTGYGQRWAQHPELATAPRMEKPVDHKQLVRLLVSALAGA